MRLCTYLKGLVMEWRRKKLNSSKRGNLSQNPHFNPYPYRISYHVLWCVIL
jgi:hypothetical protein